MHNVLTYADPKSCLRTDLNQYDRTYFSIACEKLGHFESEISRIVLKQNIKYLHLFFAV